MECQEGFSLVELMVVLLLVGIAMIPLSGIQFGSRHTIISSDHYSDAVAIAQTNLEEMRAQGFSNADTDTFVINGFNVATSTAPYVDPGTGATIPSVERLTVIVSWNDRGRQQTIDLNCLQAQR